MHLVLAGAAARSHVYPSLALISELVSRGRRVQLGSHAVGRARIIMVLFDIIVV